MKELYNKINELVQQLNELKFFPEDLIFYLSRDKKMIKIFYFEWIVNQPYTVNQFAELWGSNLDGTVNESDLNDVIEYLTRTITKEQNDNNTNTKHQNS